MEISVKVVPDKRTEAGLKKVPDKVMYQVARMTLDMANSTIPFKKGRLRESSMGAGVRGSNSNYYIGSYTNYASYVWKMPDSNNWTTPGTNNKWYARTLKKHGKTILDKAVNQGWRETM